MTIEQVTNFFLSVEFLLSVGIVVLAFCTVFLIKKASKKYIKDRKLKGKHATNAQIGLSLLKYAIYIVALLIILQIYGVNIGSLVTGMGIATAVVAFAVQDILKDFIMGINLVSGKFFDVGDVIKYGNTIGIVRSFNMRTTKIYDIDTGNIITVSNRNISEIQIISDRLDIVIPTSYDENAEKIRELMRGISQKAASLDDVTSADFLGTDSFSDSSIDYRIRIHCKPALKGTIRRQVLGIVQDVFAENGVQIPFNQLDVHLGNNAKSE